MIKCRDCLPGPAGPDRGGVVGGRRVTGWKPVSDSTVLVRLDMICALTWCRRICALGVSDFGSMSGGYGKSGGRGLELFFNDQPMTLARWPNTGFIKITDVLGPTPVDVRGDEPGGHLRIRGRPPSPLGRRERRLGARRPVLGLGGAATQDCSDRSGPEDHRGRQALPFLRLPQGQAVHGFNILAELDTPCEWYLDREKGILYFWPPTPIASGTAVVSTLPSLVTMKGTSHTAFRGFTFEAARGTGIVIEGGRAEPSAGMYAPQPGRRCRPGQRWPRASRRRLRHRGDGRWRYLA